MIQEAMRILLMMVEAVRLQDEMIGKPGGARALAEAAHRLADDPAQPKYVTDFAMAIIRGIGGVRAGLSPGEIVQREVERGERAD